MNQFDGVWSAMTTPLTQSGEVDADSVGRLVEHQLQLGIKGFFLAGTAGEGPFLPDRERARLVECVVKHTAGRVPIAMQITDNSAERMIENLWRYQDLGIDIAVIAPPFFQLEATQEFMLELYQQVIDASNVPVGIYNRGKFSSVFISPETLGRILDNSKVILCKDSSSQEEFKTAILDAKRRRGGTLAALCGDEFNSVPYLASGYDGVLFGGACFNGAYAVEMHRLVREGRIDDAKKLQEHLNSVMFKVFGGESIKCWLAGQKELMVRLGIFNTPKCLVNYHLDDECSKAIDDVIAEERKWLLPYKEDDNAAL